ncbi:MAG TPA: hypothetical protein VN581_07995 [Patescibacteria group bacterium]|nr:hypothetical protein [Patescibacteria group bacterium]
MSARSRLHVLPVLGAALAGLSAAPVVRADSPVCSGSEILLSWPADNPIWELCYLRPSQSSGPRGSGLELRNVHLHGKLALKRAHSPLLFAEYTSNTCYRDWKDTDGTKITWSAVHPSFGRSTTTSCDRSKAPTSSYGNCPFQLVINGSGGAPTGVCGTGVTIEDFGSYVEMTTQYDAAWYKYSSRFRLYADGSFEPEFGFGNSDGTNNNTTHWHHNYWRLDFDIEGAANDVIQQDGITQAIEFKTLRCSPATPGHCGAERRWQVKDTVTSRGFELDPGDGDYVTPTNQSNRGFHNFDVFGTVYNAGEYGDLADNSLGDCAMIDSNLADGGDLDGPTGEGTDVVLYYRGGVRDKTADGNGPQDSMVCKRVGPKFRPIGIWYSTLFVDGFE